MRSRSFILAHRFLGEVGWARHRVRTCNILRLPFGERTEIPPCGRDDNHFAFCVESSECVRIERFDRSGVASDLWRCFDGAVKCAATNSEASSGHLRFCTKSKPRAQPGVAVPPAALRSCLSARLVKFGDSRRLGGCGLVLGWSFAAAVASRCAHDFGRATRKGFCRRYSRGRAALPRGTGREMPRPGISLCCAIAAKAALNLRR